MSVLMSLRPPFQRGEIWYYEIDRKRLSLKTKDKHEAHRRFNAIRKLYLAGKVTKLRGECTTTLAAFADEVLEWAKNTLTHETWRAWRSSMDMLKRVAGRSCLLDMVSARHWDMIVSDLRGRGRKATSVNSRLVRIRSMLSKAVEWGYIQSNPLAKSKRLPTEKRPPSFIYPEDVPRFLASVKSLDLRRVCAALLYSGRRQSEILSLTWEDVDLGSDTYSAMLHKTKERRDFPMHPMFRAVIESMPPGRGRVFPNWSRVTALSAAIKDALVKAGYPHLRPHDLRHTFASMVILAGNDLKVAQELLGHANIKSTMIYTHLTPSAVTSGLLKIASSGVDFCGQIADRRPLKRVK